MTTEFKLTPEQEKMFQPGRFFKILGLAPSKKVIRRAKAQLEEDRKRQADEMRRIAREEIAAASRERE